MPCSGETKLWRAVILRALNDVAINDVNPLDKAQARRWLSKGGAYFQLACDCAGVDPHAVKEAFFKIDMKKEKRRKTK